MCVRNHRLLQKLWIMKRARCLIIAGKCITIRALINVTLSSNLTFICASYLSQQMSVFHCRSIHFFMLIIEIQHGAIAVFSALKQHARLAHSSR